MFREFQPITTISSTSRPLDVIRINSKSPRSGLISLRGCLVENEVMDFSIIQNRGLGWTKLVGFSQGGVIQVESFTNGN
jgi:hypothetical protein